MINETYSACAQGFMPTLAPWAPSRTPMSEAGRECAVAPAPASLRAT